MLAAVLLFTCRSSSEVVENSDLKREGDSWFRTASYGVFCLCVTQLLGSCFRAVSYGGRFLEVLERALLPGGS